ncbi:FecR domain-containing protein [Verrucomicrobiota bacterium]
MNNEQDNLIHILLTEMIEDRATPDFSGRILGAIDRKERRFMFAGWTAVAAAAAILLVSLVTYFSTTTPEDVRVAEHIDPAPNTLISTKDKSSTVSLGGYCFIETRPQSILRIEGKENAHEVYLKQGEIICEVEKNKGKFSVRTDHGIVSVIGTKFRVKLVEERIGDDAATDSDQMFVRAIEGIVSVKGAWETKILKAGESATMSRLRQRTRKSDKSRKKQKLRKQTLEKEEKTFGDDTQQALSEETINRQEQVHNEIKDKSKNRDGEDQSGKDQGQGGQGHGQGQGGGQGKGGGRGGGKGRGGRR